MPQDIDPGDLDGFSAAARRAVALAEVEARALGHDRVGTEHLLLGILSNDTDAAAVFLTDSGVLPAATRAKVSEAIGTSPGDASPPAGPLPRTPRAARALGRSVRFAHARGSDAVGAEHVLLGVLDVEGTAGQVLRGLGLDIEHLRAALDDLTVPAPDHHPETPNASHRAAALPATCPSCGATLATDLVYRVMSARGDDRAPRDALVFSCGACGRVLGVTHA